MPEINRVGKGLGYTRRNSEETLRRSQENFPMIERKADFVRPENNYRMEFNTQSVSKSVRLNLYLAPYDKPCEPEPIDIFVSASADCPQHIIGQSSGAMTYYLEGFSQIGGFVDNFPAAGVTVPLSGVYQIRFANGPAGVSLGTGSYLLAGILVNGALVASQTYGALPGLNFYAPVVNLFATTFLAAGSVVGAYMEPHDIAFWTPSDFCGLTHGLTDGHITSIIYVGG